MEFELAIELIGAVKRGRRKMIGPLNLQIPAGYIVALVGPNGAGKSTIMQMILQIIAPDEGEIKWYGLAPGGELPLEIRRQIGYVPENPAVDENFVTPEEAAKFRSHWYPDWDAKRFERLMDRFDVPRRERLNRMSKGERRKFEIAAALAAKPKLLLLDEPSSGLDPFAWGTMIEELKDFMDEGGEAVSIVLSTHMVEEVKRLADYIALVHEGKVLGMAEKDLLLGSWKEFWLKGENLTPGDFPGTVIFRENGPGISKLAVRNNGDFTQWCGDHGLQVIQSRSMELEEILKLWMQGHPPGDFFMKEGEK
ncbi:MAG: ABC transporter ATP-binding protein [Paenibacillus macerans]|uniref:ABC transporter ATP-binding protein n=1 Tax=Paenibacillus macerans TaxID=44252 RepID=UPI00290DD44A|nr:ABC transporter ATP-binding protein [Paenibacillus macerans]MDU7473896.1 ABC transporter ATP-binding protein [Paenibacillus macerans]MED4957854.1 ABC transporter ATP-binding protein [Paenibacillus macerans]